MRSPQAGFETSASASAGSIVPTLRGCSKCSWTVSEYCTGLPPDSKSSTAPAKGLEHAARCQGGARGHTRCLSALSRVRDCSVMPHTDRVLAHPWRAARVMVRANRSCKLTRWTVRRLVDRGSSTGLHPLLQQRQHWLYWEVEPPQLPVYARQESAPRGHVQGVAATAVDVPTPGACRSWQW